MTARPLTYEGSIRGDQVDLHSENVVRLVDADGNKKPWTGPPYHIVEFIDWHGGLVRMYLPLSLKLTPAQLAERIERAKSVHSPTSREACCVKQQSRIAAGGVVIPVSRYRGPWQPLEMEMLPEIVSSFSPARATVRESPQ